MTARTTTPAPDMLIRAMTEMNVCASETVMVGDSRNDALAGRAAGVSVALVETGYNEGVSIADWAERRDSPASIRAQERCASGSWPQADCNLLKARILIDPRG